jgi:hypothetical protein
MVKAMVRNFVFLSDKFNMPVRNLYLSSKYFPPTQQQQQQPFSSVLYLRVYSAA